jgi:hypothetical protein
MGALARRSVYLDMQAVQDNLLLRRQVGVTVVLIARGSEAGATKYALGYTSELAS